MTVETSTNKSGPYHLDGETLVFQRTFKALRESHVRVIQVVDGREVDIITGFWQTGIGDDAGEVIFASDTVPLDGDLFILRAVPNVQETDYSGQGRVHPPQIESDLDLLEMQIQDLKEETGRALKVPVTRPGVGVVVPEDGHTLVWDEDLQSFVPGPHVPSMELIQEYTEAAAASAAAAAESALILDTLERSVRIGFDLVAGRQWYPLAFDPGNQLLDVDLNGIGQEFGVSYDITEVEGVKGLLFLFEVQNFNVPQRVTYTIHLPTSSDPVDYETRAQLVAALPGLTLVPGQIINAGRGSYQYVPVATEFDDLPGLVPFGAMRFSHFGAAGDGVTDDTGPLSKAFTWALSGAPLLGDPGAHYIVNATLLPPDTIGSLNIVLCGATIEMVADAQLFAVSAPTLGKFALAEPYAGGLDIPVTAMSRALGDGDVGVILSQALDPFNRYVDSGSKYRVTERFIAAPGGSLTSIKLRRPLRHQRGVLEGSVPVSEADWVPTYTPDLLANVRIYDPEYSFRMVNGTVKFTSATKTATGFTARRYLNPDFDIDLRGTLETGVSFSGCYGGRIKYDASGPGANRPVAVTGGGMAIDMSAIGHGYGQIDNTESTISNVWTADDTTAFAAGRVQSVSVLNARIIGGGANVHLDTHSGAEDWLFSDCLSDGAQSWAVQVRGQRITHVNTRAINAMRGVQLLTESNSGQYNNGRTPSSITHGVIDGGDFQSYEQPLVVNASRAEIRGDVKMKAQDDRGIYVAGGVLDIYGSLDMTLSPGVNRGTFGALDVSELSMAAYNQDFARVTVHPGAHLRIDARTCTTAMLGIRALTNARVNVYGTVTLMLPASAGNLLSGGGHIKCHGDGLILFSYEGEAGNARNPIGARTGLRVKSLDGTFVYDDVSAFSQPTAWADFARYLPLQDGALINFNGVTFQRDSAAALTDSPAGAGWKPFGVAQGAHWNADPTGAASSRTAVQRLAQYGGDTRMTPGTYRVETGSQLLYFAPGGLNDWNGATINFDLTVANDNRTMRAGAGTILDGLTINVTESNWYRRGMQVLAGTKIRNFRQTAATPFPSSGGYNQRGGAIQIEGPNVEVDGAFIQGIYQLPIGAYIDASDTSNMRLRNIELKDCGSGVRFRQNSQGSIIDGLLVGAPHPSSGTDPGNNAVTGAADGITINDVFQVVSGSGAAEHFVYLSGDDGTKDITINDVFSNGQGQCFIKLRGIAESRITNCHGGGTSIGNTPGTNEDGFRFEFCRWMTIANCSIKGNPAGTRAGYDGVHLMHSYDMDFSNMVFGGADRATFFLTTPADTGGYTPSPNLAVENIRISNIIDRPRPDRPFLMLGKTSSETTVKVGNITVTGLQWHGALSKLIEIESGMTVERVAGSSIHISGTANGEPFYLDWPAADPVPTIRIPTLTVV